MSELVSIPLNDLKRQHGLDDEIDEIMVALRRVIDRGWYIRGAECQAFESEFAEYCGARFAVGVPNGTDAIELALKALGLGSGDRVITVANAGYYSTTAIRAVSAEPVYVDIEPTTLLMSLESLSKHPLEDVRAIIVTHLYGRMVDVTAIMDQAIKWSIPVIEDCAQAHGAEIEGQKAGSLGTLACFSFYPTKNLGAMGDGGAVVTNDETLATRVRRFAQYGWEDKYRSTLDRGVNSRLDEIQAAILRVRLPHLDVRNQERRELASEYGSRINHAEIIKPLHLDSRDVHHLYVVRSAQRESLRAHLFNCGISSDIHYPIPDYRQPSIRDQFQNTALPETELACQRTQHEFLNHPSVFEPGYYTRSL
jgi:dTDP-4-amino-4,6-dideoxygalactose transaminase